MDGDSVSKSPRCHLDSSQMNKSENEMMVKPNLDLLKILKDAGADKEVFTVKEVIFHLGNYIMRKELYDKQHQHLVHCGSDPLGEVLGVSSFSVKEPRALFAMISKNFLAVKNPESTASESTLAENDSTEETNSHTATSSQQHHEQRRRRRSGDPASGSVDDESGEPRKRHKSDSISLTFDDSLSWCVIGGLRRDRGSSESSVSHSNSDIGRSHSEESDNGEDSESDNFSVEFEVESIDSDAYSGNDEDSVPGEEEEEEEVYEVTIIAEDEDSFDEDTEITEADYWKCAECEDLNPPLPRHCKSCWKVRPGWLPEVCPQPESTPARTPDLSCHSEAKAASPESPVSTPEPDDGVDVPDGKLSRSQPTSCSDSQPSSLSCSQPSTSFSQEETPELERVSSSESGLPATCLEPCVICQSRPKNGCIVHGRTGHLMSCYTCAKKLKNRNKPCPVCREPIQSVVLTYIS